MKVKYGFSAPHKFVDNIVYNHIMWYLENKGLGTHLCNGQKIIMHNRYAVLQYNMQIVILYYDINR